MNVALQNLGTVNKNKVMIGDLTIWFSYETPVAYHLMGTGMKVVRQNDWSTTTGKLLNELEPDKKDRISGEDFESRLSNILNRLTMGDI